jgi:hypothetical protein
MVGALATADELCVWTSCMWGAAQGRKLRQRKGSQLLHEGCRADDEARVHVSQSDVSITTLQAGPTRACFVVGCFFSAKSVERLASNGGVEGESADPVRALCMSARQPEQRAAKNEVSFWVLSVSVSTTELNTLLRWDGRTGGLIELSHAPRCRTSSCTKKPLTTLA